MQRAFPSVRQISQYNATKPELGVRPYVYLLSKQSRAEGFIVTQFAERYPEGIAQMAQWIKEGKLKCREHVVMGFENAPSVRADRRVAGR